MWQGSNIFQDKQSNVQSNVKTYVVSWYRTSIPLKIQVQTKKIPAHKSSLEKGICDQNRDKSMQR